MLLVVGIGASMRPLMRHASRNRLVRRWLMSYAGGAGLRAQSFLRERSHPVIHAERAIPSSGGPHACATHVMRPNQATDSAPAESMSSAEHNANRAVISVWRISTSIREPRSL